MKEIKLEDVLWRTEDLKEKKVWYVAIIGRPNAGKSTFLNAFIGQKISITSDVPQTTRNRILAIYNTDQSQVVFFDTPWIHKSEKKFNEAINNSAISSINDADLVLHFIDSSRQDGQEEQYIGELLNETSTPILKVYTKIDLRERNSVSEEESVFWISSVTKEWFEELENAINTHLKIGTMMYPADYYTEQGLRFRVSEIIREKVFSYTSQELPHSVYTAVEEIEETKKMYKIAAYVYVETESQKYIIIGKQWALITKIGTEARVELEWMLDKKVFLSLRAKVRKDWRKDENFIKKLIK